MLSEQATKICAICPHASDCASAGSCLDDVNTKYLADSRQQFPRLITPFQANRCAGFCNQVGRCAAFTMGAA